jgi:tetratricopeptide (TPR) repeat protein
VLTAAGRDAEAIAALDWLLGVDLSRLPDEGPAYDARLFGELAHEGRGLCLFRLGRYEEAAEAYAAAACCAPARPEYLVKRNLALARARRANEDPAAGRSIRKEDPGAVTLARPACPAGP